MERKYSFHFLRGLLVSLLYCFLSPAVSAQSLSTEELAQNFLDNWLSAWQAQDTEAYFSFYDEDFQPSAFSNISDWRQRRSRNISRPQQISITRESLELISANDSTVMIRLQLVYRSPDYADRTIKQIKLRISSGSMEGIIEELNISVQGLPEEVLLIETDPEVIITSPLSGPGNELSVIEQNQEQVQAVEQIEQVEVLEQTGQIEQEGPVEQEEPVEQIALEEPSSVEQVDKTAVEQFDLEAVESDQGAVTDSVQAQAAPRRVVSTADWVPPGFENLNQPQVTEIDVYYGGYFLTSVLAEFTDQEITILDVADLTAQLNNLKSPDLFSVLLAKPLDAHNELLCFSEFQTECGSLETDSVEVIFDRSQLRMWLFIAPDLLQDAGVDVVRFLPPSEAGLSFMNQTAAYFTTQELKLDTYNIFNNTLFAWGENRLSMRSNLVNDTGFDIDTVAFFREFEGRDYRLGLVRESANGFSFMPNERFVGASYASSLLTRTDLEQSLGTEIQLYFSTRSRVEIYQEGRLISTAYYNVGNHLLDTSNLPNGSYMIEIRTIDAGGGVTIEERYYSKTANIPPADQSTYFVHIGSLKNELDSNRLSRLGQDELLVRAGYNKRLSQSLGGSVGISSVAGNQFVEMGLFKQGQNFELQANAAYENTGATGVDLRLRYRHPNYNINVNGRRVFNGLEDSQIGLDYQQFNSSLEIPTRNGYFGFFHRQTERPEIGRILNTGIRFRTRNRNLQNGFLNSTVELSKNDDEVLALWTFNWMIQGDRRSSIYSPTLAYANESSSRETGLYGSYESNWYRGQEGGNEYIYALRGDYDSQSSVEARMEAYTNRGNADITGRYNQVSDMVELSGRISSSFATTGEASAIGGKRRSESAFLVRVEGMVDADARFNVLVNGTVRGQMDAGETLLIPVSPYYTYDVELTSVGDTLVELDNRIYRETMYPGNVVNLSWSTQVINIAVGRLVDEQGEPLSNAVIQNVVGIAMTDDNGIFQAEIGHDTDFFEVRKGQQRCVAEFTNPAVNDTVLPLGTLACR